jgi:hypothetical protein
MFYFILNGAIIVMKYIFYSLLLGSVILSAWGAMQRHAKHSGNWFLVIYLWLVDH